MIQFNTNHDGWFEVSCLLQHVKCMTPYSLTDDEVAVVREIKELVVSLNVLSRERYYQARMLKDAEQNTN